MEHSIHRKTFIKFSRFGPLVIEVNQSEILENYNTFITQHDATIQNYLLPSYILDSGWASQLYIFVKI